MAITTLIIIVVALIVCSPVIVTAGIMIVMGLFTLGAIILAWILDKIN